MCCSNESSGIEPVEYRAFMRLLNLKGSASKKALDEMKVVYEEDAPSYDVVTGMVSSSVVVHQWKPSQFLGNPCPSLMMPPSSRGSAVAQW